jgi:serine/threonine-protein kinase
MDDDDEIYTVPRGRPVLAAFLTSLITTAVAFVALSAADRRGWFDFLNPDTGAAVEVPSVNGVTVEQARELLRAQDLLLTLQGEHADPAIPAGKVGGQVPFAGSRAPRGSAVQAYVSTGAGDILVPALAGEQPDDAVEKLHALKLAPGHRREQSSETIAAGRVIGTDPPAGRAVSLDALVTLIISTGPAPRPVPKVLGLRLARAKKILEDAGFKVGATRTGSSDRFDDDVIIKQEPAETTPAVPGSAVDLIIND